MLGMKMVAAIAIFVLASLVAPRARGKGTQSNPPPPTTGVAAEQKVQAPLPSGRVHVDGTVASAHLLHTVPPVYPLIAQMARIQGAVVLRTVIGKEGTVRELQYVSGPLLLMRAALDAVHQWKYSPFLVNGEPVEADTTNQVIFVLKTPGADDVLAEKPTLARRLQRLLPENLQVGDAAKGYKKIRDFEIALCASRDLKIPFVQFKCTELGGEYCNPATKEKPKDAVKAIAEVKPGMSKDDAKKSV